MYQDQGSLESAVNGDYNFSIGEILSEAWEKVSGAKLKIVGAMFIYIVIASLVTGVISLFLDAQPYYDAEQFIEGIAVDTHVMRLSKRLGLSDKKDANKIELDLLKIIPKKYWGRMNHVMIDHGRSICSARKPKCDECVVFELCVSKGRF